MWQLRFEYIKLLSLSHVSLALSSESFPSLSSLSGVIQHFVLNLFAKLKLRLISSSHIPPFYWYNISHLLLVSSLSPFSPRSPCLSVAEDYAGVQFQSVLRILHQPAAVSSQDTQRLNRGQNWCVCVWICMQRGFGECASVSPLSASACGALFVALCKRPVYWCIWKHLIFNTDALMCSVVVGWGEASFNYCIHS